MVPYLHFIIGGYLGSAKEVRWKNNVLTLYNELVIVEELADCKKYNLPANDERLQAVFHYLSKKAWNKAYKDPYICDGYFWSLEAATESFVLETSGVNKMPKGFRSFTKLLNAITKEYGMNIY